MWWQRKKESDLERELRSHVEAEADELREAGVADPRNAARRNLGNTALIREQTRAMWGWMWLETLAQDLRYACRSFVKMPGFALVTVLSIGLGVGLNSSVFSVIHALLLRPLPVPEPARMVRIFQHEFGNTSYLNYRDLEKQSQTLESLAIFSWPNPVALALGSGPAEQVWSAAVSANYFETLEARPQLGRAFFPNEDDQKGEPAVIVIDDGLWRTKFNADPQVLGRTVQVNNRPMTIVGVAPANMPQTEGMFRHQVWIPVTMSAEVGFGDRLANRRQSWLRMIGRLKPGATLEQLRAEALVIAKQIARAEPVAARALSFNAVRESDSRFMGMPGVRQFAWVLQAVVLLVLAIACANIANLQLARSLARSKEIGIRLAIGAGSSRIFRQFVTESLLLAVMGGAVGLLFAVWGSQVLIGLAPPVRLPMAMDVRPDATVLGFGVLTSILIGLALGLVAVAGVNRVSLKVQRIRSHWRDLLVGGQVALSLVLLVAAGLFVESLRNARGMDLGFEAKNRLAVEVNTGLLRYTKEQTTAFHNEALRRVSALPGVLAASSTIMLPLAGGYLGDGWVWKEGDAEPSEAGRPMIFFDRVGAAYFETMGSRLVAGREFTERDRPGKTEVAVVNETFAKYFWPGEGAVGKRFRSGKVDAPLIEVVGVVRDGRYHSLGETPQKHVYQPFLQGVSGGFEIVLKTAGDPAGMASAVRTELRRTDGAVPITKLTTIEEHLGFAFWGAELGANLLTLFAALGLVLSAIGLYGVLAFVVNRSIPEIGIRLAIGATPNSVLSLFIRRGLTISVMGAAAGVLVAIFAAKLLGRFLYGVNPSNPVVFASVTVLLLSVTAGACYLPARRAATVDPLNALRNE